MILRTCATASLLLGLCLAAARAEDAVKPDEFDRPASADGCEAYGSGFARLPGTSTCVKVSGQVRFEKRFSGSSASHGQTQLDIETRSD